MLEIIKSILSAIFKNPKILAGFIVRTLSKLSGFKEWLAVGILSKILNIVKKETEKSIDKMEGKTASEKLKIEMAKEMKDIDWKYVDSLEKEILEGK